MRIYLQFEALSSHFIFPMNYNNLLQGFIYRNLSEEEANFLHNTGFKYGKRTYRLFVFSRILGKYFIKKGQLYFSNKITFAFSTPVHYIIENLASNLIKETEFYLGENKCLLSSIAVKKPPKFERKNIIKMLSPMTIYSTLENKEGLKKIYYYSPQEKEFSQLLSENIRRKYQAFTGKSPGNLKINIKPYKVNKNNLQIIKYKDFIMQGWTGLYEISGSKKLMKLAYDTGLGSKNSQGFGMFEIFKTN